MRLYRIAQEPFALDLSGNGARLYGGRWNSEGNAALYTSSTRALALLEVLVHTPIRLLRHNKYLLVTLELPDDVPVQKVSLKKLSSGWDQAEIQSATIEAGDRFLEGRTALALAVPSVLVPEELNYVLNPAYPGYEGLKIVSKRSLDLDHRLLK